MPSLRNGAQIFGKCITAVHIYYQEKSSLLKADWLGSLSSFLRLLQVCFEQSKFAACLSIDWDYHQAVKELKAECCSG